MNDDILDSGAVEFDYLFSSEVLTFDVPEDFNG
jgi:hypothetical protein